MFFIIICLATFRLTRLIVYDRITYFMRKPFLDEEDQPKNLFGELISCYWCTGIWCSAFLLFGYYLFPIGFLPLILILAVAGVAGLIETFI